jgi:hypothetical protein
MNSGPYFAHRTNGEPGRRTTTGSKLTAQAIEAAVAAGLSDNRKTGLKDG